VRTILSPHWRWLPCSGTPRRLFPTHQLSLTGAIWTLVLKRYHLPHYQARQGEDRTGTASGGCVLWVWGGGWGIIPLLDIFPSGKELSIIDRTGFSGYFLIIADIARFARSKKIPICGKGSAAGSLVSYLLGISNVDPIRLDLYFERFPQPGKEKSPPDIDIDICSKRRIEVLDYLSSKYGKENVSRVCSFSTLRSRAAIRETGRIMGLGEI